MFGCTFGTVTVKLAQSQTVDNCHSWSTKGKACAPSTLCCYPVRVTQFVLYRESQKLVIYLTVRL